MSFKAVEKTYRAKVCKACNKPFTPDRPQQSTCDWQCAIERAKMIQDTNRKKERLKSLSESRSNDRAFLLKKAQVVFNTFIRTRDAGKPCITCGTLHAKWDAGHYLTRGARPEHRFNEMNASKQCYKCNVFDSGRPAVHRQKLIEQHGLEAIENMESDATPKKYTVDEIKNMIEIYKSKVKEMTNGY